MVYLSVYFLPIFEDKYLPCFRLWRSGTNSIGAPNASQQAAAQAILIDAVHAGVTEFHRFSPQISTDGN